MTNPILQELSAAGVSIWLDDLSRDRIQSGNLAQLIEEKNVVGVTTNPTIFATALSKGTAYDDQVASLAAQGGDVDDTIRAVTTDDVRNACDILRPVYDASGGQDGRVSIEVDPRSARNAHATVEEAQKLWSIIDRPNLFIKIPATIECLPAITETLGHGISVNVTLIFSLERYQQVMEAYINGIGQAKAKGLDISGIASVASFFVSRVDSEIDKRLEAIGTPEALELRGKAAIANARLAYKRYEETFTGNRWNTYVDAGAVPQKPLWASTGVKNPDYDDTMYVTQLVAPNVVNTMPEATLDAVADHGIIKSDTVTGFYTEAQKVLEDLNFLGIDYDEVVNLLEEEGLSKFEDSWTGLIKSVSEQLEKAK